ncbi:MAG: SpoIIE family protein phosphatase [Bacteroidetes bacterium]|nr:SpoIIE family protein phosphatase [Bacteroidota bacterium]MCL5266816.1 SpoIIE family protein phosphatase [Bacteroidota bacterium]
MTSQIEGIFARQLHERRKRLEEAAARSGRSEELTHLLRDVDRALDKINNGTYGLCEICKDSIEPERLTADPLIRYCLDHLTSTEQRALEMDLELARQIQTGLLPRKEILLPGWENAYHYEPSGPVSGDYCDIIVPKGSDDTFFFIVGDITGKGIAASILMSQLHATFRALAATGLPLHQLMGRANRIFCEASLITHFATLVCGLANSDGNVEISNAGHCLPLVLRSEGVDRFPSSGLPLGITCDGKYTTERSHLKHGEMLLLYTDGLSESTGNTGERYGDDRVVDILKSEGSTLPSRLIAAYLEDLNSFASNRQRSDDLTLLALRKV